MVERILSGRFYPLTAPFPFRRPPAPLTLRSHALLLVDPFNCSVKRRTRNDNGPGCWSEWL